MEELEVDELIEPCGKPISSCIGVYHATCEVYFLSIGFSFSIRFDKPLRNLSW